MSAAFHEFVLVANEDVEESRNYAWTHMQISTALDIFLMQSLACPIPPSASSAASSQVHPDLTCPSLCAAQPQPIAVQNSRSVRRARHACVGPTRGMRAFEPRMRVCRQCGYRTRDWLDIHNPARLKRFPESEGGCQMGKEPGPPAKHRSRRDFQLRMRSSPALRKGCRTSRR